MWLLKKRFALLLGLLSFSVQAEVIPVYQIDQAVDTYVQATLTHDIYRYSADPLLNDLVVTDQQGNKLPHRVITAFAQVREQSQHQTVRFFPVAVGTAPEMLLVLSSASIRLDANEISVTAIKSESGGLQNQNAPVDFYVVDMSDVKTRADNLIVNWPIEESTQYLEVQVSGTNDMSNWTPITTATLVQLQKEGEQLTRNKISLNLSEKQFAYLKLKFTRGGEQLQLTQTRIENNHKKAEAPIVDTWQVAGALAESQNSALHAVNSGKKIPVAAWEFERDDIAPVTNVSINLGSTMYGDSIKVFSRRTERQPWQLIHQGIWFNAQVGNEWQQSNAIQIYSNSDTQWRIELNELVRTVASPQLVFTRQPETLQFIANNAAPYKIAIDTQAAPVAQQTSTQIFSQLVTGKEIRWSESNFIELKPNVSSFARHNMNISWKTILFWAILIGAVAVLVFVAVRLMGQMKSAN